MSPELGGGASGPSLLCARGRPPVRFEPHLAICPHWGSGSDSFLIVQTQTWAPSPEVRLMC